jgi:translation initiation factor 3 subunit L
MQLPNQWLWDMVDEFVYQFQSFCQYRAKMKNKTEQEIALLRQFDPVKISLLVIWGWLFYIMLI